MNRSFQYVGLRAGITMGVFLLMSVSLLAQEQKEVVKKSAARMSLSSTQENGDSILLQTAIKTKREGGLQTVPFEWVQYTMITDSVTQPLGKVLSDDKGVASLKFAISQLKAGADGLWMFSSSFEGNDLVKEGETDLSVKPAGIEIAGVDRDSVNVLTVKLYNPIDKSALAKTDVKFYVKRHFSNLVLGEGTTNENGEASIEISTKIPGDIKGTLVLIAKAEDLEEYGSVSAAIVKPWGTALAADDERRTRELWSHEPPLWMVITFAVLMSVVWGHYIVIIFNLAKIRNTKTQNL